MEIIRDLNQVKLKNTVVMLGNFDGIHKGHATLIEKAKAVADQKGLKTVFFTFYPHPAYVLSPKKFALINTAKEKEIIAEKLGFDYYFAFPFNKETASIEASEFIQSILVDMLDAKAIVVGEDYHFGKGAKGDIHTLENVASQYGYDFYAISKLTYKDRVISSTWIRECIKKADMPLAKELMGRSYFIQGTVIHGAQLGRKIGFPTANVRPESKKQLPMNGIYATMVSIDDRRLYGLTYLGTKPTIEDWEHDVLLETNLLDFDEDIYGKSITVHFDKLLRGEIHFESVDALIEQMHQDEKDLRSFYGID